MKREQTPAVLKDLAKKMVFIVGPRQAGKTWLANEIARQFKRVVYLNYDHFSDRKIIRNEEWLEGTELLILDELHKMPKWENYLKGVYDTRLQHQRIIVTGSARLDIFRRVGDSLAGRFFIHHLLPFSPAELRDTEYAYDIERFIVRGGFPEPFLADDPIDADRWRAQYIDSLIRIDVFEFENIENIKNMQLVFELLRSKVGSSISYKSIAEDVGIAPNTVKKYIRILESLYIVFRVTPFSKNIARSLVKEPKIYFYDTGLVQGDIGTKLENFVALCLLKHTYAKIDYEGKNYALHYLRTKDGLEVDFALVDNGMIEHAIEVKYSDKTVSKSLRNFKQKYNFKSTQLVNELRMEYVDDGIEVRRLDGFLTELKL